MKYSCDNYQFLTLRKYTKLFFIESLLFLLLFSCSIALAKGRKIYGNKETIESNENATSGTIEEATKEANKKLKLGIEQTDVYLDALRNKRVGVVSNHTGMIGNTHLVDTLIASGINVIKVFAPEHGFRGKASAGEHISSSNDVKTGLPIMSLYGETKKPGLEMMEGVEIMIFDIQDVGIRFYTYISTLHYVMEACAEAKIPLVVLDRPNPNGHYVDGPVLDMAYSSFIGMHPVPIVYGMTIGEYGQMINGEKWLSNGVECELTVIPLKNYNRKMSYILPIPPSPNLRTNAAIYLYPSLCFFEGTSVSVGRGTEKPFEVYGHPNFPETGFSFTPSAREGASHPLWEKQVCNGYNLLENANRKPTKLNLSYFINAHSLLKDQEFVTNASFLNLLVGNNQLVAQLDAGMTQKEIRATWQINLVEFKIIREKYLIY